MNLAVRYSDIIITIDADLQDDVNAIYKMVDKYHEGFDVVYGVRNSRETDTFFKKHTALMYYKLMQKMGVNLVPDSADYRLLSKRATESLLSYKERNLFLRGMVPLIGYKSAKVYYPRKERYAGTSKYPLKKMIHFALDGITSFSIAPIHLILSLGIITTIISIVLMIYTLVQKIMGHVVSGLSSLMISIWLLGGIQLISISTIGEYVGKVFTEVKHRPRFNIEDENYSIRMNDEQEKKMSFEKISNKLVDFFLIPLLVISICGSISLLPTLLQLVPDKAILFFIGLLILAYAGYGLLRVKEKFFRIPNKKAVINYIYLYNFNLAIYVS